MIAALVAVGFVLIGATVSLTLRRYGELPDQIPMHFWFDGTSWGLRHRRLLALTGPDISAALSGTQRIEMAGFYLFLGVMLAIGFAAASVIGP